jgi:trehalose synthase
VIGDVIPGHTGKGPDFRLAERAHADYPGLYHMVSVDREDWPLLPEVPSGRDAVNLSPATVDALRARGYIAGRLQRTFFHEPGIKDTDWSATPPVRGVDGVERRWVYLHYFKQGQPTLNWLDPSFAAARLVVGDVLHEIGTLGDAMIRLDANGYLGIEPDPGGGAWSQGHPLSVTANRLVAGMVRKLGGFTFQELNLTLEDLRAMSEDGADLSYDFVTRPAYHHALATGDAEFLRLMLRLMHEDGIDPASLIHALQNHDELTLELIHFWGAHKEKPFPFRGGRPRGAELRAQVHRDMFGALTGARASYNLKAGDGIACTTASLIAAALGYAEVARLAPPQVEAVKKAHLLLAFYNAFQPGIFALSGWDLVGALTLPAESVRERMADGDARWINRGAYDLLGAVPEAERSAAGLPRAAALYGPLPAQLADPASFASQLAKMLTLRAELKLHAARQTEVPEVRARGLLVMVHELPEGRGTQLSAINFGREPVDESVAVRGLAAGARVSELPGGAAAEPVGEGGRVHIRLASLEGKALLVGR